jgi:chromosome segregation ATPase
MRKPVQYTLLALIVLLLGATAFFYQKYEKRSSDYSNMVVQEQTARNQYGEAINSIAAIQDSLNGIVLGDSTVRLINGGSQAERRLSNTQKEEVLDRIALLKAGVERTKERIAILDQKLRKSGVKVAGLSKMVANLKQSIVDKEAEMGMLTTRVDSLQTAVTGLVAEVQVNQDTIRSQAQNIEDKRKEIGTIYYVMGNKKELTKQGVVIAKGGLLGIGKTLKPTGQFDEAQFTAMDTDQETVVHIPSAKVEILSEQPPSSYQLQVNGNETELHIIDPAQFRRVKHLVILTS